VVRLEKDAQVHPRFIAFIFLKNSRHDGARKTRLSYTNVNVFVGSPLLLGFFAEDYPPPSTSRCRSHHVSRHRNADCRGEAV